MTTTTFQDVLYGKITVTALELPWFDSLIHYPDVQRLQHITQLGLPYQLNCSQPYSRYQHSLGTCYLALEWLRELSESIIATLGKAAYQRCRQWLGIAALLHDIGHGPFSHTFEQVFKRPNEKMPLIRHEHWTTGFMDRLARDWLPNYTQQSPPYRLGADDLQRIGDLIQGTLTDPCYYFLQQMVSSAVDADRMDYVLRDAQYYGIHTPITSTALIKSFQFCIRENPETMLCYLSIRSSHKTLLDEFHLLRQHLFKHHYLEPQKIARERYWVTHFCHTIQRLTDAERRFYFSDTVAEFLTGLIRYWNGQCSSVQLIEAGLEGYRQLTESLCLRCCSIY